jgi:hypothetical protein
MPNIFDDILVKGVRAGKAPAMTTKAREWYRKTAGDFKRVDEKKLHKSDPDRLVSKLKLGNLYMFYYDAKHKETLPYFDRFPLIYPFRIANDRFWGINLHYLPLPLRAKLMDALYDITNNTRFDESTKLMMTYKILNASSKFKWFKPCVKEYLFSQVQTRFMYIFPSEWDIALFLPLERFVGASKSQVWADSRKLING